MMSLVDVTFARAWGDFRARLVNLDCRCRVGVSAPSIHASCHELWDSDAGMRGVVIAQFDFEKCRFYELYYQLCAKRYG